ncbi:exo-alpha-sialidase [Pleurocapsa sp. PCC 7319]|uniref:exo-alpha-sialidase n=1 Tax=Pleurocapsa sp. PCC 7319 TaxID=118161 RepID=UPI00034AF7F4|nr:exo-alpha-sialidase [Pleurocapsa sp. PCC 7319]
MQLFEAENLTQLVSGAGSRIIDDIYASGDKWVLLDADNVGDYIQFLVPNILAGDYMVEYRYKSFSVRGIVQMSIGNADGNGQVNQGAAENQSVGPNNTYRTIALGAKSFAIDGDYTFRFQTTVVGDQGGYKISVDSITLFPISTIAELEAENLTQLVSGASSRLISDSNASEGNWIILDADNVGDYIQFLVPNILAGDYMIEYRYKSFSVRGIVQMSIGNADGTGQVNQGAAENQSVGPDNTYRTVELGAKSFATDGDYTFRFQTTAVGEQGGYKISVDKITLIPISVTPPSNLSQIVTSATSMRLTWEASPSNVTGYRIERMQGSGSWDWIGDASASQTSFESVGMGANQSWNHRIRAFNDSGVSNYVNADFATTSNHFPAPIGFLIAPKDNIYPRRGEGSIVVKDDLVRYYYGRYQGNGDTAPAAITFQTSNNGGDTWSSEEVLFEPPSGRTYILPSIINLPNENLGLSYADVDTSGNSGRRIFRFSENSGHTWSEPIDISDGVFPRMTGSHDRLIQSNNRLLYPIHTRFQSFGGGHDEQATYVYISDNNGLNWIRKAGPLRNEIDLIGTGNRKDFGFWECAITTTATLDKLLMVGRTDSGFIYKSVSTDNGDTWSEPETTNIVQPKSPPNIARIPGENTLVLIFEPWHEILVDYIRRPVLGSFISNDDGETWENFKIIEYDGGDDGGPTAFHYSSIYFDSNKDAYLTYYGQNDGDFGGSRFRKLPSTWFTT